MSNTEAQYILTLNSNQAKEIRKAVELLLRLKLGQYDNIPYELIMNDKRFADKRDAAMPHLQAAWLEMPVRDWSSDVCSSDLVQGI